MVWKSILRSLWVSTTTAIPSAHHETSSHGIAVCLAGGARTITLPIVHKSIRQNLVDVLDAQVFAVVTLENENELEAPVEAVHSVQETLFNELNAVDLVIHANPDSNEQECVLSDYMESSTEKTLTSHKWMKQCFELVKKEEERRGFEYEWVIKARPDEVWVKAVDTAPITMDSGTLITSGHTDRLFIAAREFADSAFGFFDTMCKGADYPIDTVDNATGYHRDAEGVYRRYLESVNIPYQSTDFPSIIRRHSSADSRAVYYCETYKGARAFGPTPNDCLQWLYDTDLWDIKHKSHLYDIPIAGRDNRVQMFKGNMDSVTRVIHQTAKTSSSVASLDELRMSWLTKNPGWEWRFYDDEGAMDFVRERTPEYYEAYLAITEPVIRADFFRYIVLFVEGGIYSDVDTECVIPLEEYIGETEADLIVGLEANFNTREEAIRRSYARQTQVLQWTLLAKTRGHPALKAACDSISKFALTEGLLERFVHWYGHDRAILEFSGPGLWTDIVFSYMARSDGKDVRLLPQLAWGSLERHRISGVYVLHHFHGSWKKEWDRQLSDTITETDDATDKDNSTETIGEPPSIPWCFSGKNLVKVQGKGCIPMQDLQIGDFVQASSGYDKVIAFGHHAPDARLEYLQVHVQDLKKPLELTRNHMVFQNILKPAIPAAMLKIGDEILLGSSEVTKVTKLLTVTRTGAYGPFTSSGTIVVSDVLSSNYISLEEDSEYLTIAGYSTPFPYQWMCKTFVIPYYQVGALFVPSQIRTYNNEGISTWVLGPYRALMWLVQQEGTIVNAVVFSVIVIGILVPLSFVMNFSYFVLFAIGVVYMLRPKSSGKKRT